MNTKLFTILFLLLTCGEPAVAQENGISWEDQSRTIFNDLYTHTDSLPVITIETDLRQLVKEKYEEPYQPAVISWTDAFGGLHRWDIKLRARGNRRKDVCYYPPVKLNFDLDTLALLGYEPYDKIKIVNQCRGSGGTVDYLLKEYLAYRLYQKITPASLRARLVRFRYLDTSNDMEATELWGILLEPEQEMTARLNAQLVEFSLTRSVHLDQTAYNQLSFFQYMVGNTDWNVSNRHNLITVKEPDVQKLTPIPYDFDYTGLVSADYAVPHESLPIDAVQERYHKGIPMSEAEVDQLTAKFEELIPEFLAAVGEITLHDERCAKDAFNYLSYFFDLLNHPKILRQIFVQGRQ